jgi:hypothetical protein
MQIPELGSERPLEQYYNSARNALYCAAQLHTINTIHQYITIHLLAYQTAGHRAHIDYI